MCTVTVHSGATTRDRANNACALDGATSSASTPGHSTGPPAEKVYAVEPVGVAISTPSQPYAETPCPSTSTTTSRILSRVPFSTLISLRAQPAAISTPSCSIVTSTVIREDDLGHRAGPVGEIAHHTAHAEPLPADLELPFHHRHQVGPGGPRRRSAGSARVREMNDRSARIRTAGPPIAFGVRVRTFVRSCSCTPLVGLHPLHQLTVAKVYGSHLPDAAAEQHVGKTAGGRAGIQAPPAGDLHVRKRVERTDQPARAAGRRPVPVGDLVADEEGGRSARHRARPERPLPDNDAAASDGGRDALFVTNTDGAPCGFALAQR